MYACVNFGADFVMRQCRTAMSSVSIIYWHIKHSIKHSTNKMRDRKGKPLTSV